MYEQLSSASPAIQWRWRAEADEPGRHRVAANEYWGVSFIRRVVGTLAAELNGPTVQARSVDSIRGEVYWGVALRAHVVVSGVDKSSLLGETVSMPVHDGWVHIAGHWEPVPQWDDLEAFVRRLLDVGALVSDDHIRRALAGDDDGYSPRSWQRRYRRVVGVTRTQVEQLDRARRAYLLLQDGRSPAEVAAAAGYADQAHLTRSLRVLRGATPARIIAGHLSAG